MSRKRTVADVYDDGLEGSLQHTKTLSQMRILAPPALGWRSSNKSTQSNHHSDQTQSFDPIPAPWKEERIANFHFGGTLTLYSTSCHTLYDLLRFLVFRALESIRFIERSPGTEESTSLQQSIRKILGADGPYVIADAEDNSIPNPGEYST